MSDYRALNDTRLHDRTRAMLRRLVPDDAAKVWDVVVDIVGDKPKVPAGFTSRRCPDDILYDACKIAVFAAMAKVNADFVRQRGDDPDEDDNCLFLLEMHQDKIDALEIIVRKHFGTHYNQVCIEIDRGVLWTEIGLLDVLGGMDVADVGLDSPDPDAKTN